MVEMRRPQRALIVASIVVLAVVTLLRFAYLRSLPGGGVFVKYLWFANEIMGGRLHRERLADLSPLYLWLITFLRWLGATEWTIRFLQVSMVSVTAWCAGAVAHRFAGWVAAIAAVVIVLANRAALVNATDFEPEALLLVLEALAIALVLGTEKAGSRRRDAAAGLLIGLAIITRPVALLTAIVLGAWLIWRSRAVPWMFGVMAAVPVLAILIVNARLTGDAVIMDPGTVFYEGMNPRATGCTGTLPRIVSDLEPTINGPDTLHVAYRIVAGKVLGKPGISRSESNRWWAGHALAYLRTAPAQAAKLTEAKLASALESHDYYDVMSMDILARSMTWPVWIPWSVVLALALAAVLIARREAALSVGMLAAAAALPMLVFFVSARHRNPLLIPASILAGLAIDGMWRGFRAGESRRRAGAALAVAVIGTALLSIETQRAAADDYLTRAFMAVRSANAAIAESRQRGDAGQATLAEAYRRTWNPEIAAMPDARVLAAVARNELTRATDTQRLFRIGIALDDAGSQAEARRVLEAVDSEEPQPTRMLPPPSLYLARSFVRGGQVDEARRWLARARDIAPASADVLALAAILDGDRKASTTLLQVHDPFTATLATCQARLDLCRSRDCTAAVLRDLQRLHEQLPQWTRPAQVAADEISRITSGGS